MLQDLLLLQRLGELMSSYLLVIVIVGLLEDRNHVLSYHLLLLPLSLDCVNLISACELKDRLNDDSCDQVEQGDVGEIDVQEPEHYVKTRPSGIAIHGQSTHFWPLL